MAFTTIIKDVDGFFTKLFSKTTAAQKILAAAGALAPLIEAGLVVNGEPRSPRPFRRHSPSRRPISAPSRPS